MRSAKGGGDEQLTPVATKLAKDSDWLMDVPIERIEDDDGIRRGTDWEDDQEQTSDTAVAAAVTGGNTSTGIDDG